MDSLPIGKQVSLPGHFESEVVLEAARPLGKGFECRVRLSDGSLEEAVITAEEAAALAKVSPAEDAKKLSVIPEDEVDLESGYVMLPQAIPQPVSEGGPSPGPTPAGPHAPGPVRPGPMPTGPAPAPTGPSPNDRTEIELTFTADRNQLFNARNAVANLADLAGQVKVTIKAENSEGLDKSKLQNGVIEPLREADLIE